METITVKSTSRSSAQVVDPIVIDETSTTRRVFIATINDANIDAGATVSGTVVHQRKKEKDEWENVQSINLATLKSGEGVKLAFDSKQLRRLYDELTKLYQVGSNGVQFGQHEFTIAPRDSVILVPEERREVIKSLLDHNYGEEVWEQLVNSNPDLATQLCFARLQSKRVDALQEFEQSLRMRKDEGYWGKFFQENTWIFGYGLDYRFLQILQKQAHVGRGYVDGTGSVIADFLLCDERFTVVVELKRPDTPLFKTSQNRSNSWSLSSDVVDAVSQILEQKASWQISGDAHHTYNNDDDAAEYRTFDPKCILIIGSTEQFGGEKREGKIKERTFELFRRDSRNIEILTYDELFNRAKCLVEIEDKKPKEQPDDSVDDDLPF